jgi:hypothetical protein
MVYEACKVTIESSMPLLDALASNEEITVKVSMGQLERSLELPKCQPSNG